MLKVRSKDELKKSVKKIETVDSLRKPGLEQTDCKASTKLDLLATLAVARIAPRRLEVNWIQDSEAISG